jgi:hypothetical protein
MCCLCFSLLIFVLLDSRFLFWILDAFSAREFFCSSWFRAVIFGAIQTSLPSSFPCQIRSGDFGYCFSFGFWTRSRSLSLWLWAIARPYAFFLLLSVFFVHRSPFPIPFLFVVRSERPIFSRTRPGVWLPSLRFVFACCSCFPQLLCGFGFRLARPVHCFIRCGQRFSSALVLPRETHPRSIACVRFSFWCAWNSRPGLRSLSSVFWSAGQVRPAMLVLCWCYSSC